MLKCGVAGGMVREHCRDWYVVPRVWVKSAWLWYSKSVTVALRSKKTKSMCRVLSCGLVDV